MKKFLYEYKYLRSKPETATETSIHKWERLTVTTRRTESPGPPVEEPNLTPPTKTGTIRTEKYKRDLAEFQARRSSGSKEPETPLKKKCGRHSLPISCTNCTDPDNTFNYEKKSASKYMKKSHKRAKSASEDTQDPLPNIQFLFQNQVFMPGNIFPSGTYTEPQKRRQKYQRRACSPEDEFFRRHIEFKDDEQPNSPPLFFKNNSLPFDVRNFLDSYDGEVVDGPQAAGDVKVSSRSSSDSACKDDSCADKLVEVMSELNHFEQWADDQLRVPSLSSSKSEDNKSDVSAYGLPIVTSSDLDVNLDKDGAWSLGKWGAVPVQIRKLRGVTMDHVKKKQNIEINILRKCRHPNVILLMGLYPDIHGDVHIVCERFLDTLYGILHVQGRILSAQTALSYAADIGEALVFLRMRGYVVTELSSRRVAVAGGGAAKLADCGPARILPARTITASRYHSQGYVNIGEVTAPPCDCEPLLSRDSSESYLARRAVSVEHAEYRGSEHYRWHAPELFEPDEKGRVYPCARTDVYSLALVLWESCNAAIPWRSLSYSQLRDVYTGRRGLQLPADGTYPGQLLSILRAGLSLERATRPDLETFVDHLKDAKLKLDELEYIVIPARLSKKRSEFSPVGWDTTSPTDSECQSPITNTHEAIVHNTASSDTENRPRSDSSPQYETIRKDCRMYSEPCFIGDETDQSRYQTLPGKEFSSACSTPISKVRAKIKCIGTPGTFHRSDSTEYCSILSVDNRHFTQNDSDREQSATENANAKLSKSFTPKSYKPLHIKVPECNLDSLKDLPKGQNGSERSSYKFDIKNYSLPTTPIARNNKLRKNAWLSGELSESERDDSKNKSATESLINDSKKAQSAPETPAPSTVSSIEKDSHENEYIIIEENNSTQYAVANGFPESNVNFRDKSSTLKRTENRSDFLSPEYRERTQSWSFKSSDRSPRKSRFAKESLANVNVKPLVAIHERWIYEANKKNGRSMSLPDDNRSQRAAVKPASHCVDTLQKSLPQLSNARTLTRFFRGQNTLSPTASRRNGALSEQFCRARDNVARSMNFGQLDRLEPRAWAKLDKSISTTSEEPISESKTDRSTDTSSIEEYIKDLIKKELHHILHEIADDVSTTTQSKSDDLVSKGVTNVMNALKSNDESSEPIKSFSRVKINGNSKPLLQITFSRNGESSLQVLDNCVHVTVSDGDKHNVTGDDTLMPDESQVHSLKRCQTFSAIQEARSTEDLYIDDDLSTHMQENFGRLLPLHGSLHELLCERADDCCLVQVRRENGCDSLYFRCDNSDTESRDAVDGKTPQDTVVYKRSISVVEERIQRVAPKNIMMKPRPKSEVMFQNIKKETRALSNSSPSLAMKDANDEVEVNIEHVMSYQDSSSDESIKCDENEDFELLEAKIEADVANGVMKCLACNCLEKISEENLSAITEECSGDSDGRVCN